MKNSRIKNIIFDLGDVILNIDVPLASSSFGKLSGREQHEILTLFKEKELFRLFETGLVDEDAFRNMIRELLEFPDWSEEILIRPGIVCYWTFRRRALN